MRSILKGRPQQNVDNHARDKPLAGYGRKDDHPTPGDYLLGLLLVMAAVPPATIIIFKLF